MNTLLPWMAKIRQSEIKKMPKESLFHYCSKSALCVWNMLWHLHFFRLRAFINILLSEVLLGFITSWVPRLHVTEKKNLLSQIFLGTGRKRLATAKKCLMQIYSRKGWVDDNEMCTFQITPWDTCRNSNSVVDIPWTYAVFTSQFIFY